MRDIRSLLLRYGITTAVGGAIAAGILWMLNVSGAETPADTYGILADAFTVPGVLMLGVAGLLWVSSDGFFDALGYAASSVGSMLIPLFGGMSKHQTYYEYVQSKKGKRVHGYSFLVWEGLAFLTVGIIFWILYASFPTMPTV